MNTVILNLDANTLRTYHCEPGSTKVLSTYTPLKHVLYDRFQIIVCTDIGHFTFDLETDRFTHINGKVYEIYEFYKIGKIYKFSLNLIDLFNLKELLPDKDKELYAERES